MKTISKEAISTIIREELAEVLNEAKEKKYIELRDDEGVPLNEMEQREASIKFVSGLGRLVAMALKSGMTENQIRGAIQRLGETEAFGRIVQMVKP